ncbi:MAG: Kae1-associated serine/threonine protein kinase [Candidatus Diapherotrites archaeon]|nr:Kae1-associated serine/threonine protein kinase [Candidatus Diapherotrites archaeon]
MELIREGAEAKLFKTKLGNETVLLKQRVSKAYRNKELDNKIRKQRTTLEANLLRKTRGLGVNVPEVLEVDREKFGIYMEFVDGTRVKDVLNKKNSVKICTKIGESIAKMHSYNIIHGDLTTSNILQKPFPASKKSLGKKNLQQGELFFIDFGLGFHSKKIEDKAVDLIVFKKTFEATHNKLMPQGWSAILEGYQSTNTEAKQIFAQIEKVEKRGRYH